MTLHCGFDLHFPKNVEKSDALYVVDGNVSWVSYYGKQCGGYSKI
jgi:hypothetical protein